MSTWLTVKDVAALLDMHPRTVLRMCHSRSIRCCKLNRQFRLRPEWVNEFMQRRELQVNWLSRLKAARK